MILGREWEIKDQTKIDSSYNQICFKNQGKYYALCANKTIGETSLEFLLDYCESSFRMYSSLLGSQYSTSNNGFESQNPDTKPSLS